MEYIYIHIFQQSEQNLQDRDHDVSHHVIYPARFHSQVTETIELARPDSSNVELSSKSKDFKEPGIAWVKRNGLIPPSFSSE